MRTVVTLALAAALVAIPASAQEANQMNTAETPTNVDAGPDAALNDVALPPIDEAVPVTPAPALEPVSEPAPGPARDDDGFPWGLIGLIGLVGLLGRARS